ncbi:MAG: quinol:cytochrome C oxidoreductase [Bacteroidota bacterium]|nr:quinol:cytochrome C oxidoreductase [Bacteroidota bacterium]
MNNQYVTPAGYKKWSAGLMIAGLLTLIGGIIFLNPMAGSHGENVNSTRFWAVMLQNSLFWLMLVNTSTFFIGITTLAMGGWQVALRRVSDAISSLVPVMGLLTLVVILSIVFGHRTDIYPWLDKEMVAHDEVLKGKSGFLNPFAYAFASILCIGLWAFVGKKLRDLSLESDKMGTMDYETGRIWLNKNLFWAAFFIVLFGLTVGSTMPWFWLMSIDAHWFSTMYSWYTFASTFVSGIALITLFVIYFKNRGQLEFVTEEHLQDLGKFMFAFSIFWTYLWFDQFMLIWYGNIPEETIYFKIRSQGPYRGLFFLNLVLNFICPLLIFMKKATKRNYTIVTFMCVLIIFGHWIDFYQMVMPGTVKLHPHLSWYEFGIPLGFVGIIMWGVGRFASKAPMTAINHPFLKESIIHHV